ncbi:hypothetical protein OG264_03875 [Streptomyces xanthophaeus]|uniref:hypothetical protein n=1 Tax=Streptomyces xanthophaeus TaxID=67385 RepID=UPI003868E111|nr:hypothetical protein OG264_03875 [Streptomyces xanthophaeus]WST64303.1 hypothetical protein OG605_34485 [Streptomyces xanthophaeus]
MLWGRAVGYAAAWTGAVLLVLCPPSGGAPVHALDGHGFGPAVHRAEEPGVPRFRLRAHENVMDLPASGRGTPAPVTPGFVYTGTTAPGDVWLSMSVADHHVGEYQSPTLPAQFANCFYASDGNGAYCRFPGPLVAGQGYETDVPFQAVNGECCRVRGTYRYVLWVDGSPGHPGESALQGMRKGSGPALGLRAVDAATLSGGSEATMEYQTQDPAVHPGWLVPVRSLVLRGEAGGYVELEIPFGVASEGFPSAPPTVRVELPEGTSPAPRKVGEHPSEETYCGTAKPSARTVVCHKGGDRVILRLRIDRKAEDARGSISVAVPPGDTDPADNVRPIELRVTGAAGPALPRPGEPGRPWAGALAAVACAASAAVLLLVARRRAARRRSARRGAAPRP